MKKEALAYCIIITAIFIATIASIVFEHYGVLIYGVGVSIVYYLSEILKKISGGK